MPRENQLLCPQKLRITNIIALNNFERQLFRADEKVHVKTCVQIIEGI